MRHAIIQDTLDDVKSKRYRYAARYLAVRQSSHAALDDYGDVLPHARYVEELKQKHGQKYEFWQLLDEQLPTQRRPYASSPMIRRFFTDYILPIVRRPNRYQVAALCWRVEKGVLQFLLLTSRETRRWILPKGWPTAGLGALAAAREEAWEEGGVRLEQDGALIGSYCYSKRMRGVPVRTNVDVFAVRVTSVEEQYPEATERERRWVTPEVAAEMVDEPDLAALLRNAAALIAPSRAP